MKRGLRRSHIDVGLSTEFNVDDDDVVEARMRWKRKKKEEDKVRKETD